MARLKEIAEATGYSICMVSQVLRGRGKFSEKAKEAIFRCAQQTGYQANAAAALLASSQYRSKQTKNQLKIALIGKPNDFYYHSGFTRACKDLGYDGECIDPNNFQSPRQMVRTLSHRGFSGLLLKSPPQQWSEEDWLKADWRQLSVVKQRGFPRLNFPMVCHSAFDYMLFTLRQVFDRGYRRIAVLLLHSLSDVDDLARKGAMLAFAEELRNAGGTLQFREINLPQFRLEMIRNYHIDTNTRRWLNRFKPDAIVGFPFVWIYSLRAAGFRIPEEMGFASPISSFYFHGEAEVDGGDPMVEILEYRMVELLHTLLLTGMRGMSPTAEIGSLQDVVLPKWIECGTLPTLHWQNKTVQSTVDASPARYDQRTHKEKEGHPLWLAW